MFPNISDDLHKVNQHDRSVPRGTNDHNAPVADQHVLDPEVATAIVDGLVAMAAGHAPQSFLPQLLLFRVSIARSLRGMGLSAWDAYQQASNIAQRAGEELHRIWEGISFDPDHAGGADDRAA